jgi:hypothetical protein
VNEFASNVERHRRELLVHCYRDSTWRAMALDVLRIEDGLITEIVVFPPGSFPAFRLPMVMDAPPKMNKCH